MIHAKENINLKLVVINKLITASGKGLGIEWGLSMI